LLTTHNLLWSSLRSEHSEVVNLRRARKHLAVGAGTALEVPQVKGSNMFAVSDISGVVDAVSGYWDAAAVVAIGVLLFVLGRRVVKKI